MALWRVLSASEETQPGLQVQVPGGGMCKRRCVELEFENFPASPAPCMQPAQAQRRCESQPVGIDGDVRDHGLSALSF